ncbi:DUF4303 domain-containing protein, partial [Aquimarina sp. 2201CG1-2-11]|uniref:DUF4303 domain-containing protein n=1 Tax=Aquimarina discodermiae TaxID=3231043 RepID=UPI0034619055
VLVYLVRRNACKKVKVSNQCAGNVDGLVTFCSATTHILNVVRQHLTTTRNMTEETKNTIHDLAVKKIIADFDFIKEKSNGETIYGFGLGIVGDITGFFSAGNTIESIKRKLTQDGEEFDSSDLWYISEWEYEGTNDNTLYKFLATFIYDIEDGKYESAMKDYEDTLIKALKTCDKKGIFGKGEERENIIVYLHYADATDENVDDNSSEQINPENIHSLFKQRWNDENNNLTKIILEKTENIA